MLSAKLIHRFFKAKVVFAANGNANILIFTSGIKSFYQAHGFCVDRGARNTSIGYCRDLVTFNQAQCKLAVFFPYFTPPTVADTPVQQTLPARYTAGVSHIGRGLVRISRSLYCS